MARRILIALCVLIFAPFVLGQMPTCPTQTYPALTGYEVAIDATRIAYDHDGSDPNRPAPKRLFLQMFVLTLGQTATFSGYGCDPEGNLMSFSCSRGIVDVNETDWTYTWTYTPTSAGMEYVNLSVTDTVTENDPATTVDDPKTTTGTFVVKAVRENRPPVLCGGRP